MNQPMYYGLGFDISSVSSMWPLARNLNVGEESSNLTFSSMIVGLGQLNGDGNIKNKRRFGRSYNCGIYYRGLGIEEMSLGMG